MPALEKLKPDMIGFQETKAEEHQSEVDLHDYEEYWHSSKRRKGYSGTAIFTKIEPLSVIFGIPDDILEKYHMGNDAYGDPNEEGRVVTAEFDEFFFTTVYTPNSKDDLSRIPLRHKLWDPAFLTFLRRLER